MKILDIKDMKGGWFVGDFEPTAFKTKRFEVAYHFYKKGQKWDKHYHEKTTEINYIIRGEMTINGEYIKAGDIFIIEPYEISDPVYLTDCEIIITRDGSFPNDKIVIK